MNNLTNGVTIEVVATGEQYHTLNDWGLAIGNNNYISAPEQETSYIRVPGAQADLDLSEYLTGRPVFKAREISVELGGLREPALWDNVISDFRNKIDGKLCHLIFDNDLGYFWKGRVAITGYDRARELGRFTLTVPHADPYKYEVIDSTEPWLWDPFDFLYGIITSLGTITMTGGTRDVIIPAGHMETVPTFTVTDLTVLTLEYEGNRYALDLGDNYFPKVKIAGTEEKTLTISGTGTLTIYYRGGSL